MEYVFGTKGEVEILKVKSASGTDLTGFQQHVVETDVDTTTHSFRIARRLDRQVGADAMVYDFYEIDHHNQIVDSTKRVRERQAQDRADIDFIAMETGVEL